MLLGEPPQLQRPSVHLHTVSSPTPFLANAPRVGVTASERRPSSSPLMAPLSPVWQPCAAPSYRQAAVQSQVHVAHSTSSSTRPSGSAPSSEPVMARAAGASGPLAAPSFVLPASELSALPEAAASSTGSAARSSGHERASSTGAPSAALMAAVQLAAAACSGNAPDAPMAAAAGTDETERVVHRRPSTGRVNSASLGSARPEVPHGGASAVLPPASAPSPVPLQRRPSESKNLTQGSFQQMQVQSASQASPVLAGRTPCSMRAGPGGYPARRRWASISDDEASPMIWPLGSPMMRPAGTPKGSPLSLPMAAGGGGCQSIAEHLPAPFLLPQSQSPEPPATTLQTHSYPAVSAGSPATPFQGLVHAANATAIPAGSNAGFLPYQQPPVMPPWAPVAAPAAATAPHVSLHGAAPAAQAAPAAPVAAVASRNVPSTGGPRSGRARAGMAAAAAGGTSAAPSDPAKGAASTFPLQRPPRAFNGWTVIWVGERAFRAPTTLKEQIEAIGFLVKIYRSHEKCCRALDKRPNSCLSSVFLAPAADVEPILAYLRSREANLADVRLVVDAEGKAAEAQQLTARLAEAPEALGGINVVASWEDALQALQCLSAEVTEPSSSAGGAARVSSPKRAVQAAAATATSCGDSSSPAHDPAGSATAPSGEDGGPQSSLWTLVWISDQAFKPAASALKAQLEALGCQVKGYKTNKNATRALDKKRALARTVVLVSGTEAVPLIAYLGSRPELSETKVVVEASSRAVPVRESPTCQVVETFEAAVAAVQTISQDPSFV